MGVALALLRSQGVESLRLFCPAGMARLIVNVPEFRPEDGEAGLSLSGGGTAAKLVADAGIVAPQGGVSAAGVIPAGLASLTSAEMSARYGALTSGPYLAPPQHLSAAFVSGCTNAPRVIARAAAPASSTAPTQSILPTPTPTPAPAPAPAAVAAPARSTSPCMIQGSEQLTAGPRRASGTEPFWGAKIEGRCVTYSHPGDQKGTRVWTRYTKGANGETWTGALNGKPFELRVRAAPRCSDGMSGRRYPLAAEVTVSGGRRNGCAGPG